MARQWYNNNLQNIFQERYLLAPVQTIFPELNINAVVRGSRILIMTAAKRFGLYSAFLACKAIFFRSNLQFKLTVQTIFLEERYIFESYF